jgi:hypothetical protein
MSSVRRVSALSHCGAARSQPRTATVSRKQKRCSQAASVIGLSLP